AAELGGSQFSTSPPLSTRVRLPHAADRLRCDRLGSAPPCLAPCSSRRRQALPLQHPELGDPTYRRDDCLIGTIPTRQRCGAPSGPHSHSHRRAGSANNFSAIPCCSDSPRARRVIRPTTPTGLDDLIPRPP